MTPEKEIKIFIIRNRIRNAVNLPFYQVEQTKELNKLKEKQ